jgi:hypothetical protein
MSDISLSSGPPRPRLQYDAELNCWTCTSDRTPDTVGYGADAELAWEDWIEAWQKALGMPVGVALAFQQGLTTKPYDPAARDAARAAARGLF